VGEWLTFLQQTPTSTGALRSLNTIATSARSVRPFGNWLVRKGVLACPLLSSDVLSPSSPKRIQLVAPEGY